MLPEVILHAHKWDVGQELIILNIGKGILLTSKALFRSTTLEEVAGCLRNIPEKQKHWKRWKMQ